jgi:tetratricopeptide (TPR) repeat protein
MPPEDLPTDNPKALRSYLHGKAAFLQYSTTHKSDDLKVAQQHFNDAMDSDPSFALATFYSAVVENELREHDSAIAKFEQLKQQRVAFMPEVLLHLAYAHTKKYRDRDFDIAEALLEGADKEARAAGRSDLTIAIRAYRVFLFAVIGGRSHVHDRQRYLAEAVRLGKELLASRTLRGRRDNEIVRYEIHNALGIALMRQGQRETTEAAAVVPWKEADVHYAEALTLSPNSPRVLQNVGTLRQIQADKLTEWQQLDRAEGRYDEAIDLYRRSVDINPGDQFPHYSLAKVYAKVGRWEEAHKRYLTGVRQSGSVPKARWEALQRAIELRDAASLRREAV